MAHVRYVKQCFLLKEKCECFMEMRDRDPFLAEKFDLSPEMAEWLRMHGSLTNQANTISYKC